MNSVVSYEKAKRLGVPGWTLALLKSMESLLIRGGVPVLSLKVSMPMLLKYGDKPREGLSPSWP